MVTLEYIHARFAISHPNLKDTAASITPPDTLTPERTTANMVMADMPPAEKDRLDDLRSSVTEAAAFEQLLVEGESCSLRRTMWFSVFRG